MQIRDIEGNVLKVTNLEEAIKQAELFKELRHESAEFAQRDAYLQKYWSDIYNKLQQLTQRTP